MGIVGPDTAAIAAVFGVEASDAFAGTRKIIDYLNKTGGVGGRQIVPTFVKFDTAGDASTNGQTVCQKLTEDTEVDVVVGTTGGAVFPECLEQHNVAMFDPGNVSTDIVDMRQHPNWFVPSGIRIDRSTQGMMQLASDRGVLKSGATLGVVVESCPWSTRVLSNTVKPLAKKLGVSVVESTISCIDNIVADLGPVTTDVQRATLRFASSGVTHVLAISGAEAFVVAQFTGNANQQNYHPKYLVTSNAYPFGNSQPSAIIKISPDALPNMFGYGTIPFLDVGTEAKPANAGQAAAQARCAKADPTLGGATSQEPGDQPFRMSGFFAGCDVFYAMKAALEAGGMRFGVADVARGYAAVLRGQVSSSVLVGGRYAGGGRDRLDGAGYIQPYAYNATKKRFEYLAGPTLVP